MSMTRSTFAALLLVALVGSWYLERVGSNVVSPAVEAAQEFERNVKKYDIDAAAFAEETSSTFPGGAAYYWVSKHNTGAKIVVTVSVATVNFTGLPILPDCISDKTNVIQVFGQVCR